MWRLLKRWDPHLLLLFLCCALGGASLLATVRVSRDVGWIYRMEREVKGAVLRSSYTDMSGQDQVVETERIRGESDRSHVQRHAERLGEMQRRFLPRPR